MLTQETYSCWRSPDEASAKDAQQAMSAIVRVIAPSAFMTRDRLVVADGVVVDCVISCSCAYDSRVCDAMRFVMF